MKTPPPPLNGSGLATWRLHDSRFATTWDSGEGARMFGGRWNSKGVPAVYCSLDPSTTILEAAVHLGFPTLDAVPHTLSAMRIAEPADIHIAQIEAYYRPAWLSSGIVNPEQQAFGDSLLARHAFVILPSAVSRHSWNLIFTPHPAKTYQLIGQERFALDHRLRPRN